MSSSHRELIARRSTPLAASTPTTRARVEVSNDVARSDETPSKFMFPIGTHESIADVRARISRAIAGDAVASHETNVALSPAIALSVDGYALLDEHLATDVVRDDDVVRVATSPLFARNNDERGAIDAGVAHHGYVRTPLGRVFASLAPAVSEEEEVVEEERRNKPSRSARRKSNKRAKRRAAFDTIEDLQIVSDEEGEEMEECEAVVRGVTATTTTTRAIQEQQQQNVRHRLEYRPEPLPDYDAKPKRTPEELYTNVRNPEWASDDVIARRREERYEEMRRAAEADPRDAWERFVFKSEMTDEELREFPLAESFKMNDIIAYRIFLNDNDEGGGGPSSAYYQGRVMRYDGALGTIRVKPSTEDRVGVTAELFFKLGVRAPAPYDKLGVYDGPVARLSDVRLIGGRSVWEGGLPSKIWTVGRNEQLPPGWQAGQRETPEEYESWFTEHIRIHEYQRANARKWDEEIREGDAQGKWKNHRSRPHRHERQKRQRRDEEDESAHIWPTSAEELQAKLMAEWQAEEASNALLRRDEKSAPTPGAPPANIPGVEIVPSSDNQPPPPPGSPPPKPVETEPSSSMDPRTARRRARASTAAAMARFRAEGDLPAPE